jgi:hypothetical protein
MTVLAATDWPEAAIAIAGIAFVTIVVSVAIWQIFGTGRTAIQAGEGEGVPRPGRRALSRSA